MKHIKLPLLISSVIVLLAFSCQDKEIEDKSKYDDETQTASGLIFYEGDPAVDGCGWLIEIGENTYAPNGLGSGFQVDSLSVTLDYNILDSTWNCGWRNPGYTVIEIVGIEKN